MKYLFLFIVAIMLMQINNSAKAQSLQKELANTIWMKKGKKVIVYEKWNDVPKEDNFIGVYFKNDTGFVLVDNFIVKTDSTTHDFIEDFFYKTYKKNIYHVYYDSRILKSHEFGYMSIKLNKKKNRVVIKLYQGFFNYKNKIAYERLRLQKVSKIELEHL
jgi:hypothetical protein